MDVDRSIGSLMLQIIIPTFVFLLGKATPASTREFALQVLLRLAASDTVGFRTQTNALTPALRSQLGTFEYLAIVLLAMDDDGSFGECECRGCTARDASQVASGRCQGLGAQEGQTQASSRQYRYGAIRVNEHAVISRAST